MITLSLTRHLFVGQPFLVSGESHTNLLSLVLHLEGSVYKEKKSSCVEKGEEL